MCVTTAAAPLRDVVSLVCSRVTCVEMRESCLPCVHAICACHVHPMCRLRLAAPLGRGGDGEGELDELDEGRPCGTRDWHRLHAGVSSQAEVVVCRLLSDVGDG